MKSIDEQIEEYLEHLRLRRYSPTTLKSLSVQLRRFAEYLNTHHGITGIDRINAEILDRWQTHLSSIRTRKGRPLKATGINRHIIAVRGLITYFADNGYVQSRLLNTLQYLKEPGRLPKNVLSHAQVRSMLAKMPLGTPEAYRNRAMLETIYSCGIRADELLRLDVQDIDFENQTAMVHGKGDKQRVVPVGKTALKYLQSYILAVRPFLIKDQSQKALFLTDSGNRVSYQVFRRVVKAAAARIDLEINVTTHSFRRSCTTELIRGGANIYHVKELLGHESLNTLKSYVKLTINDLKKTHRKYHPREKDGD